MSRTITLRVHPDGQPASSLGVVEEWKCSTRINLEAGSFHEQTQTRGSHPEGTYTVPDDWPRVFSFGGMDLPVPEPLMKVNDWEEWVGSYPGWLIYGINGTPLAALAFEDQTPPVPLENLSVFIDSAVNLNVLSRCSDITHLHLPSLSESTHLESLRHLTRLKCLKLQLDGGGQNLAALASLRSLTKLEIEVSSQQHSLDLEPLSALTQLEDLGLRHLSRQQDYTPLAGLTQLHTLDLRHSFLLSDLTPLSALTNLTHLNLSGSMGIVDLQPLKQLVKLEDLNLCACPMLEGICPLAHLLRLRCLNLGHCERISDLTPLGGLLQLSSLHLDNCWRIQPELRAAVEEGDFERFRALLVKDRS